MREQEYIDAQDLGRVAAARSSLSMIVPEISSEIDPEVYGGVMTILHNWESKLRAGLEIEPDV